MEFPDEWFRRRFSAGFEPEARERALERVTDWRVAIDGGAHCGIWTKALCKLFGAVYAFEPHPDNFSHLERNVTESNAVLSRAALGERKGVASMSPGPDDDPNQNSGQWHLDNGKGVLIEAIDSFGFSGVGLVKLDIEGFEYFALKGGEQTIRRDRPVIVIEENGLNQRYGVRNGQCFVLLEGWGFERVATCNKDHIFAPSS